MAKKKAKKKEPEFDDYEYGYGYDYLLDDEQQKKPTYTAEDADGPDEDDEGAWPAARMLFASAESWLPLQS